jgi:AcrR family transcriptional regulator
LYDAARAKPLIPADAILAHALQVLDAEGVEALNVRRLSSDLKISPRTLYQQVGNREAMIRVLVARHFSQLRLDFKEYDDGESTALQWCLALRRALRAHPFPTALMTIDDRKAITDYVEYLLKSMLRQGVPRPLAFAACRGLTNMTVNHSIALVRAQRDAENSPAIAREVAKLDKSFPQLVNWVIAGVQVETTAQGPAQTSRLKRSPAKTPSARRQRGPRA